MSKTAVFAAAIIALAATSAAWAQEASTKAGTEVKIASGAQMSTKDVSNYGCIHLEGGQMILKGNLTNQTSGDIEGDDSSLLEFNGSANQSFTSSTTLSLGKLKCNNSGTGGSNTVTLSPSLVVWKVDVLDGVLSLASSKTLTVTSTADEFDGDGPMFKVEPGGKFTMANGSTLKLRAGDLIVYSGASDRGEIELNGTSGANNTATIDAVDPQTPYSISIRGGFTGTYFKILRPECCGMEFKNDPQALPPIIRKFQAGTLDYPQAGGNLIDFSLATEVRVDTASAGLFDACAFLNTPSVTGPINVKTGFTTQFFDASGNHLANILFTNHSGALAGESNDLEPTGYNLIRWYSLSAPSSLAQYKMDGSTSISTGGTTDENAVVLKGTVSHPESDQVRIEIEVQPIGTSFTNTGTAISNLVSSGSTASLTVYGLGNNTFHWQARTVDIYGAKSAWASYGGNGEGDTDFQVSNSNTAPGSPSSLTQYQSDGSTVISTGGNATSLTVVLKGGISDSDGDQVQIQVEVKVIGTAFDGKTNLTTGSLGSSGGTRDVTVSGLTDQRTHHWRARSIDAKGQVSAWVSYGGNGEGDTDFATAEETGTGVTGYYYNNRDFTSYVLTRTDSTINFNWTTGSPDASIGADTFSTVWTGKVKAEFTETYTFFINSDDGARVWVNGELIIDAPTINGAAVERSGTIALTANTKYDIRVEYFEDTDNAQVQLSWSSPSTPKQIVPQARLFPTDSITAPVFQTATAQNSDLTKVYCRFSEPMDSTTATNTANWTLSGGLSVNNATISSDKRVVTLTASGNVTLGTTTVTASASIKSLSQETLAQTTLTINAGNTEGIPDSVAVTLALGTDSNKSVIQDSKCATYNIDGQGLYVNLTVTAPGTSATAVKLVQRRLDTGSSQVYFGTTGTDLQTTVTTSGGTPNNATVRVRYADVGAFKDDFRIVAIVSGEDRAVKPATAIQINFFVQDSAGNVGEAPNVYISDKRTVVQLAAVSPVIEGLAITNTTYLLGRPQSPVPFNITKDLKWVAFPNTNAQGTAKRNLTAFIDLKSTDAVEATGHEGDGNFVDIFVSAPCAYCQSGCDCSPEKQLKAYGHPQDKGVGCIDLGGGEKMLEINDLVIPGRGLNYRFRRVYRDTDNRGTFSKNEFGKYWSFSYADDYLKLDNILVQSACNVIHFTSGNTSAVYVLNAPSSWVSPYGLFTQLRLNTNVSPNVFELRDSAGVVRVYHDFSAGVSSTLRGRLKEMRDRNGSKMTFNYELIDPDDQVGGDSKYVIAYVIDTMGREIRYQYYARTAQTINGRAVTIATTDTAKMGRLAKVIDFKGNMDFDANNELDFTGQTPNRTLEFDYDSESNLVRVSSPLVTGTPNSNNFSSGKTVRYQYVTNANRGGLSQAAWDALTQAQKDMLLHKLMRIWYPNEVKSTPGSDPADSDAAEVMTYITDTNSAFFGFVSSYAISGTNGNSVPSGGTISYTYTELKPYRDMPFGVASDPMLLLNQPSLQVDVTDRNGNQATYKIGGGRQTLRIVEKPRGLRSGEPANYTTHFLVGPDYRMDETTLPLGNKSTVTRNTTSTDPYQRGNLIRIVQSPDVTRPADQSKIETVFIYEPIYNRPWLTVFPRGADKDNNGFTPPISDPQTRTMTDPYDSTKTLNLRYAVAQYFDYQESTELATNAPAGRLDIDGSGGQVNQSPLITYDSNVKTVEVWLVQLLGLPETTQGTGLVELRARLSNNKVSLGLGDLNGDNDTTPKYQGNVIRTIYSSPVLLANTNQHKLETDIETAGDLIDHADTMENGGPQEGTNQNRLQTIVFMYQYNSLGQMTKSISPEGNVTTYAYYAENNPDGDANNTPAPADGRTLDTTTGGYLKELKTDTTRSYYDQAGNDKSSATFNNNNTNPSITDILVKWKYDDVGNVVEFTNGRGIRTDFWVNDLNQTVQTTLAADISGASSASPSDPLVSAGIGPLTAFAYKTRVFFDFNNMPVLVQVEDRGNTSSVDGQGLGTLPTQATDTTPGLSTYDAAGGDAYLDSLVLYDRIGNAIESRVEVDSAKSLNTKVRYDSNQNLALTIFPEGNASSAVFDERDLPFQVISGTSTRPTAGKYAAGDPTTFDRPGGSGTVASTFTYNYDLNGNPTQLVDANDTDGDSSNNSTISGSGDVTTMSYDGYDRPKTTIDPLGNKVTRLYDPDSNVIRVIADGDAIDDLVGTSDNKTLSVSEFIYDELSRVVVVHRVLFQTPDASPSRTPTLTDGTDMDSLAAYLSDASTDTSSVPGATGITVIGRVSFISEYDRGSRPTFSVEDDLDVVRADYDGAGRVIKSTDSATANGFSAGSFNPANLSGNTSECAYDDNSNPIECKSTDVTSVTNVASETFRTTSLYDSLDRLQTVLDNRGQTTDLRYDSRSNLIATADAVGPVNTRSINRRGLGSTSAVTVNDFGNVVRYRYDGVSRLLETEMRLTSNGQGDGTNIGATLEGVLTTAPTVDTGQSSDGLVSVYYAYDDNSQLLAMRDDNGNTTQYIFDNQNRTKVERKGVGVTGTSFTVTSGDSGAFNVALRGGATPVDTESSGTDISLTYDKDSNVTAMTDEATNSFAFTFDANNRRKSSTITKASGFIATTSQTWKFDGLGRQTECFDNNDPSVSTDDVTSAWFFDSLSRQVEESQKIGSSGTARATSTSFDLQTSGSESGNSHYFYPDGRRTDNTYDKLDRLLTRRDNGQGSDIGKYEYIGPGRVAILTYQNTTRLTYIGQSGGSNADLGWDNLRRPVNHRWEKFTAGDTSPGNDTLVVGFEHQDGNATPAPMYDRANNKQIEYKTHEASNSEQYKYDSVYRLTSRASGSQGVDVRGFERGTFTNANRTSMSGGVAFYQDWDLEGSGNWTRFDDNARVETQNHTDFNEINQRTVSAQNATPTHDKNGNMTDTGFSVVGGQNFPGGKRRLEFDALNRVRKVYDNNNTTTTSDDTLLAEYIYDCGNRRLQKVVTNSGSLNGTTRFYYLGWRVMEERDGSDAILQQYVYGNYLDEVWTRDDRRSSITVAQLNDASGTHRMFLHYNTLFHVYGLTDEAGALKEAYQYDAYGKQTVITDGNDGDAIVNFSANDVRTAGGNSTFTNPYMFTGQRFDPETGIMYYKMRYYSADMGRFLSRDPIGGLFLYEYCFDDPIGLMDPMGLQASAVDAEGTPSNPMGLKGGGGGGGPTPSGIGRGMGTDGGSEGFLDVKWGFRPANRPVTETAPGTIVTPTPAGASAPTPSAGLAPNSCPVAPPVPGTAATPIVPSAFFEPDPYEARTPNAQAGFGGSGNRGNGGNTTTAAGDPGDKRGPKPKGEGPHNTTIQRRIDELKESLGPDWEHVGGGSLTEESIKTPGGFKISRRPDITFKNNKTGEYYRENVGRTESNGQPILRERQAMDDIQKATGERPGFTPYDK